MFPGSRHYKCSEKRRTDNAPGGQHSLSAFIAWQNDNIARQEAEQARAQEICRWKIAILLCNTPTPESWESWGEATECQREYDRR